ncbi:MAG: DEAD/DEAH box helicase, partial [Eubacteriales bacterium]
ELETISTMVDHLGLDASALQQKVIHLPKYRALYIDSYLRHKKLQGIGRNTAFKHLVQSIQEPQDLEYQAPEGLQNLLREYQKTGFRWLKTLASHGLGGILADEMGLGKTLQVIAFILSEKGPGQPPALVIVPTSLIFNWYEEVQKFAPTLKVVVVSGTPHERRGKFKEINGADMVVTSYPLIRRDIDMYKDIEFSYCFLDEAQHIKNPNTINAKSVQQLKARNYFALTGTPIENSLTELWSIFNFIMPGFLLTHTAFQKKYELPIARGEDPNILTEFSRHVQPFILRRLKKDVLKELPDKIETKLMAEMTKEQGKIYLAFLKQAQGEILQEIGTAGFEKSRIKILAVLTRLRQICCHPGLFVNNYTGESGKMQLLQEVMEDTLASGHRILLFSQFTTMLKIIREYLFAHNIGYFYLDGSTRAEQRQEMVRSFNEGEGKVFLISLKAGGTGLNLTGADMVIHFDPWWNPAVEAQAADRTHRIGQKNVVQVFKLITRGTIEEKIFALQQKKKELIDSVIRPGETFLSKLTEEELKAIFDI